MKVDELLQGARDAISVRRVYGEPVEAEGVTVSHFMKPPAPEDPYRPYYWEPAQVMVVTAEWITVVAVLGKLWSWADRSGRSLWDHLFGLAFVERTEVAEEERTFAAWLGKHGERT